MKESKSLSLLVQKFFSEYLITQRQASKHTIVSYRDCFSLLFHYAQKQYKKSASYIEIENLNVNFISSFLIYLEKDRGICIRSRNQRLAAIHSFFHYITLYVPEHLELIKQVLSIPIKRYQRKVVTYLNQEEIEVLLNTPDRNTWIGRRDHILLMLMIQTGFRVSEVTQLCYKDITMSQGAYIRCTGKGRKERCTPITKQLVKLLKSWISENNFNQNDTVFPTIKGNMMSSDSIQYLLNKYINIARKKCSSLLLKNVSPHVLRHTTAIQLLNAGVDHAMIALWLGHESIETTRIYLEADLSIKEKLIIDFAPIKTQRKRFIADDRLLDFLHTL
ncbi:MAG: tyrosine-type recombinase/integrase [Spirochaetes bacterium]|nr:tyrosine-type recombinase/integrase [Spirochaetota bacterium]